MKLKRVNVIERSSWNNSDLVFECFIEREEDKSDKFLQFSQLTFSSQIDEKDIRNSIEVCFIYLLFLIITGKKYPILLDFASPINFIFDLEF